MVKDAKISELTVSQLQRLIRRTVQAAVTEVIVEMSAIREMDDAERRDYETQLSDIVQNTLPAASLRKLDD